LEGVTPTDQRRGTLLAGDGGPYKRSSTSDRHGDPRGSTRSGAVRWSPVRVGS
jgi:hypothetical protein